MNDSPNQSIVSNPEILILCKHPSCWYVEHLFKCEICCVHNGLTIVLVILSHEDRSFHCCIHNHSQIIKRFPMSCIASSRKLYNILRNGSFTLFKNDRDLRESKIVILEKISAPTGMLFPSEIMWVCFLSKLSAVDLSTVSCSKTKKQSFPLTPRPTSLSSVVVKEYPRSEEILQKHCKDTTSQIPMKDGVTQSVNFRVGTVSNSSSPEYIKMPVVPTGRTRDKLAMYIASSLKCQIRSASCALGESWGPEKLEWAKRDCHQFVVECVWNGVHLVRLRRFADTRTDSTTGGSNKRGTHHWKLSIATLSVSISMLTTWADKRVSCWKHQSSMLENASKRSLPVDVELELGDLGCTQERNCWSTRSSYCRCGLWLIILNDHCSCTTGISHLLWVVSSATICPWWTWLYTGAGNPSQGKRWTTTCGARVSTTILKNCGPKPIMSKLTSVATVAEV